MFLHAMSVRGLLVLDVSNNKKNVGLKRREFERERERKEKKITTTTYGVADTIRSQS